MANRIVKPFFLVVCIGLSFVQEGRTAMRPYFSGYIGNMGGISQVTTDANGNIYLFGMLEYDAAQYPMATRIGPTHGQDFVIMKVAPDGSQMYWMTFIGGAGDEILPNAGNSLLIGKDGSIYFGGGTYSSDYPVVNPLQNRLTPGGDEYGAMSRLSADGSHLLSSTYFGGTGASCVSSLEFGPGGDLFIGGFTIALDMPAAVNRYGGDWSDGFVSRLSPDQSRVLFTRYIGGYENPATGDSTIFENVTSMVIGVDNSVVAAMSTRAPDVPTSAGAFQNHNAGKWDFFIEKMDGSGQQIYATYLGGSFFDRAPLVIKPAPDKGVYLAGFTLSGDFPIINGVHEQNGEVAFVHLNEQGAPITSSVWKAGSIRSLDMDANGNIHIAGLGYYIDPPRFLPNSYNSTLQPYLDALYQVYTPQGMLLESTILAGTDDQFLDLHVDLFGDAVITGSTISPNFEKNGASFFQFSLFLVRRCEMPALIAKLSDKTIRLVTPTLRIGENDPSGYFTATLSRVGTSTSRMSVNYDVKEGTAKNGQDFIASSGLLTWADGDKTDRILQIPIINDNIPEPDETFFIVLSSPTDGASVESSSYTVTIRDDDGSPGAIRFVTSQSEVIAEGTASQLRLIRENGNTGPVRLTVQLLAGSAQIGSDKDVFITTDTVEWNDGEDGEKTIEITAVADRIPENKETFTCRIGPVTGAALSGPQDNGYKIISYDLPDINFGADREVEVGQRIVLSPVVTPVLDDMQYEWQFYSGPTQVNFENSGALATTVVLNAPGVYVFKLMGNLGRGFTELGETQITAVSVGSAFTVNRDVNVVHMRKNSAAQLTIQTASDGNGKAVVYDRFGREIIILFDQHMTANSVSSVSWNGKDSNHENVRYGVYSALIESPSGSRIQKIVVME